MGAAMLSPKKVKHRKQHRGRMRGLSKGGTEVNFGDYGLQAIEPGWITARQIESARVAITRHVKRGGKVWINIFPDKPYTKKPAETRMGSGKGNPEGWVAVVKPGRVMFELAGVPEPVAAEAMRLAGHKLPIDCRFVRREGQAGRSARAAHPGQTDSSITIGRRPALLKESPAAPSLRPEKRARLKNTVRDRR